MKNPGETTYLWRRRGLRNNSQAKEPDLDETSGEPTAAILQAVGTEEAIPLANKGRIFQVTTQRRT